MTVPTYLGGGLRNPLMINETAWNGGTVYTKTGIVSARCFQRSGTAYTLAVSGFYKGTAPTTVQVQIIDANTSAVVVAWATLDAAPANNAFTGTVSVPQGNLSGSFLYNVQVRDSANPATTVFTSYSTIAVGIGILHIGQSNSEKMFGQGAGQRVASAGTYRDGGGAYRAWYANDTPSQANEDPTSTNGIDGFGGAGCVVFANQLASLAGVPVFILDMAIGSTVIDTWVSAANGGTHTSWDNIATRLTSPLHASGGFEITYWQQGESDGVVGTTGATYKTKLAFVESQCRTLCGNASMPFILGLVGRDKSATAANMDVIRQAQLQYVDANASGLVYLTLLTDQYDSNDDPHFDMAQYILFGYRAACAVAFAMGLAAKGMYGPKFTGTLTASAAAQTITLPITQDGGTALLDHSGSSAGTGLTPFRAFNGVTQKTISSTAFSGNNIVLTLAGGSFIAGDTINVDYMYGLPTVWDDFTSSGNPAYDNNTVPGTTLGRPLQPTRGQISATAGA